MKQMMKFQIILVVLFASTFAQAQRSATPPERIRLADGFNIELLYSVPPEDQGSWVAMCQDDKGRLIVSDQYGGIFRFPIPKLDEKVDPDSIEQITYTDDITKTRDFETKPNRDPKANPCATSKHIHQPDYCHQHRH